MRNFKITVNGTSYDVSVEELSAAAPVVSHVPSAPSAPAVSKPAPVVNGDAYKVSAPMPGVVLDVKVSAGDTVGKHQVVILLEAMKMENEIVSPVAGTVASVNVSKGDIIDAGDTIISVIQS